MSVEERILIVAAGISWTDSRELRAIALEFRKMEDRIKQLEDRIKRLEEFINRFFDPEDLGYVVSTVVRDDAREALGMKRVESGIRESKI